MKIQQNKIKIKPFVFLIMIILSLGVGAVPSRTIIDAIATEFHLQNALPIGEPFGVCHGHGHNEEETTRMKEQGVQITRNDITWMHIEPTNGTFYFDHFDRFYSNLTAQGIEPLAILDYGHQGMFGAEYAVRITEPQLEYWLRYVNKTVTRYQNVCKYWEIWNEPNLDKFWNGTDDEFFNLLNQTAHLIRNINSSLLILSPGISGHSPEYLSAMIEWMGAENFNTVIDILNYHPYSGASAEIIESKAKEVNAIAEKYGFMGEIWITEVGYSTQVSSYDTLNTDLTRNWEKQAELLVKIFPITLSQNVSKIVWYCYRDSASPDWFYGEDAFGIQHYVQQSGKWIYKPSGFAFQYLSEKLSNSVYYPEALTLQTPWYQNHDNIWAYYYFTSENTMVIIAWTTGFDGKIQFSIDGIEPTKENLVDIKEYLYKIDHELTFNFTDFLRPLSSAPIIVEINASRWYSHMEIEPSPLAITMKIEVDQSAETLIYIVPVLFLIGIIMVSRNNLQKR